MKVAQYEVLGSAFLKSDPSWRDDRSSFRLAMVPMPKDSLYRRSLDSHAVVRDEIFYRPIRNGTTLSR
jgi:hypothetical protein